MSLNRKKPLLQQKIINNYFYGPKIAMPILIIGNYYHDSG